MVINWRKGLWQLSSIAIALGVATSNPSSKLLAQITPDGTLGAEGSVVNPDVIKGIPSDRIDGGAIRGSNLFHSFLEFNIGEGRAAYFSNPAAIENIFSRVTGSNPSHLLGTLGVLGNANLFFLNPNGILFGPNASLDLGGSFVGSTASSIAFPDGTQFSATNPQAPPLLTVNVQQPIGLRFEGQEGLITNVADLAVGQDLTLAGGNLDLQGQLQAGRNLTLQATDTVKVRDSLAQPFIASAWGKLVLQGNQRVDIFALNHPGSGFFSGGDMVLRSANSVSGDANYWSGGNFLIEQLDGSLGDLFSLHDPVIRALGDVSFESYTGASLHILAGGSVKIPGTVTITGSEASDNSIQERVVLSDGITVVDIDGSAQPTLDIRAGTTAFGTPGITGSTAGFSAVPGTGGTGTSAEINISSIVNNGGVVFLTNQYQPNPALSGGITVSSIDTKDPAGGGPVTIDSRGGIIINGIVNASGQNPVTGDYSGDGGDITLLANGDITLNPGDIFSDGLLGGNITLKSQEDVSITATATSGQIQSASLTAEPGTTGGDIKVMAKSLSLSNGAQLNAVTLGEAQAGSIIIQASETVSFDGFVDGFPSNASTEVRPEAGGNGGSVTIETGRLLLVNGGALSATVRISGSGDAGDLTVRATEVEVIGPLSGLFAQVEPEATGNGGNVTIETERLKVTDGAQISASTLGKGKAGNLMVRATEVELIGTDADGFPSGFFVSVQTEATGDGGILRIDTEHLLLRDGAVVSANTLEGSTGNGGSIFIDSRTALIQDGSSVRVDSQGTGEGGDIQIQAGSLTLDNGAILAETASNTGGNITLQVQDSLLLRNNSQISTTAGTAQAGGDGGNITIDANFIVAVPEENSDITANAFFGNGGRISITAKGIFGIEPRDRLTPFSDITASSTFGLAGIVDINNPDVDPNQGLAKLQEVPEEVELAEGCQAGDGQETVAFFNIGRGGLPPTPEEPFSSEIIIAPWIPLIFEVEEDLEQVLLSSFTNSSNQASILRRIPCRNNSVSEPLN